MKRERNSTMNGTLVFKWLVPFLLLFALPCLAQEVQELDLEIQPRQFKELNPDPQDEACMFVGLRFSIVNPNSQRVKNIDIEDFSIYSESRGMVTKRDLGEDAWKHVRYVTLDPYSEFPYLDVVMVFARGTLDKYYAGTETLNIMFKVNYTDFYENIYRKSFKFEYCKGKFKQVGQVGLVENE